MCLSCDFLARCFCLKRRGGCVSLTASETRRSELTRDDMGIAFEWIAPSVTAAHTEGTATNHTDMREPPGWGDDVSPPAEEAEPETEPTPAPASEMSVEEEECLIPPSQPENDADDALSQEAHLQPQARAYPDIALTSR
jgi:hypothetical protein